MPSTRMLAWTGDRLAGAAENAAAVFATKIAGVVPTLVSVIVGAPVNGIPSLIVIARDERPNPAIPKRFRGMRVVVCPLRPRDRQ